jgi:uncharacterized damage-inducible protein DinB
MSNILTTQFLKELEAEAKASRACIERIPESAFSWKPHEKSMLMGYLTVIVAEIPKWIAMILEKGEINFATWQKYQLTTNADLVKYFDDNMELARKALANISDEALEESFYLKAGEQEISKDTKRDSISSTLNHGVHHRGQLTVYMRLNNIAVPSIYGPSADDKTF